VSHQQVAFDGPGRTWSLRREWSRAFAIVLVLLLVGSLGTFACVRQLVGHLSGTAHRLDRQSTAVASLRSALNESEDGGDALLAGAPVDPAAFIEQQNATTRAFLAAAQVFPEGPETTGVLVASARSWKAALTSVGLWGDAVPTAKGGAAIGLQATLGTDVDKARTLLDGVQKPSLAAMRKGLADEAALEHVLAAAMAAFFVLAVVVTGYFRRRMARDLLRPVAAMHEGVLKLQAGEYDHRIEVARHDELGELAEAFNDMAGALSDSHVALTLRATRDSLTGLPNRGSLLDRLSASFSAGSERRARQESVLFIDIDDFKDVNDSVGHEGGDALLVQLSSRLSDCVRPHDLVARLGGDEFAIVVVEGDGGSTAIEVAERVLAVLREPFTVGGRRLLVSVSIGVAQRSAQTADAAELLRRADFAMYMAKGAGKGRLQVFDVEMHDTMVNHATPEATLTIG